MVRQVFFNRTRLLCSPFPSDTSAFLYYFTPPKKPRIAGELLVRLRVASSDDHASFESGSDLLRLDGQPWSHSLYPSLKISLYSVVCEKLRKDGLVPLADDLDAVLLTSEKKNGWKTYRFIVSDSVEC